MTIPNTVLMTIIDTLMDRRNEIEHHPSRYSNPAEALENADKSLVWILRQSTISPEILKAIQTCASAVGYAYHRHTHDHITMNDVIASEKVNRWLEKERKS